MAPDKTLFVFITRGGGRYNTLHFRVCRIASFPIRPVDPCYISRRVVACLYSVVFTAELLVNTRRKPLVKQPVVVRDSDHGIPPCSEGIWSTTRVHASPLSRFVRGRRRTGKVRWKVRRRSPDRLRFIASMSRPRWYSILLLVFCIRYRTRATFSTVRKYRSIR